MKTPLLGWGDSVILEFRQCLVEDLTCTEILEGNPPQICFEQLELPEERATRCDDFVDAIQECGSTNMDFRSQCRFYARTRSEEVWASSDQCMNHVQEEVCVDIYDCLNTVFDSDLS